MKKQKKEFMKKAFNCSVLILATLILMTSCDSMFGELITEIHDRINPKPKPKIDIRDIINPKQEPEPEPTPSPRPTPNYPNPSPNYPTPTPNYPTPYTPTPDPTPSAAIVNSYINMYNTLVNRLQKWIDDYNNTKNSPYYDPTSSMEVYRVNQIKQYIRDTQNSMREVRQEAARDGVNIPMSSLESMSVY